MKRIALTLRSFASIRLKLPLFDDGRAESERNVRGAADSAMAMALGAGVLVVRLVCTDKHSWQVLPPHATRHICFLCSLI